MRLKKEGPGYWRVIVLTPLRVSDRGREGEREGERGRGQGRAWVSELFV